MAAVAVVLALAPSAAGQADPNVAVTVTTANLSEALTPAPELQWSSMPSGLPVLAVNPSIRYQTVNGFGAAMTDSSAWLIYDKLSASARQTLMQNLFSPSGIDIGFIRVPIGASDFTVHGVPYSYDQSRNPDPTLSHFSIAHDLPYIVPSLQQALSIHPGAFVLATPWSPPAWMKTNDALNNMAHTGVIRPADLPVLGRYFVKFIEAYKQAGIPVTAVTPQNEPSNGTEYPGAQMGPQVEAAFIAHDLAPAIAAAGLKTKIYGYDFGWSAQSMPAGFKLLHSAAARDLAGMATHCYYGSPTAITAFHAVNPRLDEIMSECSPGIVPYSTTELIISSTRNWASMVALWNLALNPEGGPVEPPNTGCNGCTGLVTINERQGSVAYTRDYYQLGQFSKFVEPGAVRVASPNFTTYSYFGRGLDVARPGLEDVAFQNPDGSEVLVAYDDSPSPQGFDLESQGRYASYVLSPGETATLEWNRPASAAGSDGPYTLTPPPSG
jgi:glucosylceramidase